MTKRIDPSNSTYSHFTEQIVEAIRQETFGRDIGQNICDVMGSLYVVRSCRDDVARARPSH